MLAEIRHYGRVTLEYLRLSILTTVEYPANIIGWLLSNPIQFIVGFAAISFAVKEFGTIAGWSYGELAFLYGLAVISHALSMILFVQGWFMGDFVLEGEFDRYLLRPMSVLYQFFFTNFNLIGITDLIPGICVFAYGCVQVGFEWTFGRAVSVAVTLLGATLIRGGIYLMLGSTSLWTKSSMDFGSYTQELLDKTTMYPLSMYPESLQLLLTYLLPIGWISFYPAAELLGMENWFSGCGGIALQSLCAGVAVFVAASLVFQRGMRRYESAGN